MDTLATRRHVDEIEILREPGVRRGIGSGQFESHVKRPLSCTVVKNSDPPCFPFLSNADCRIGRKCSAR